MNVPNISFIQTIHQPNSHIDPIYEQVLNHFLANRTISLPPELFKMKNSRQENLLFFFLNKINQAKVCFHFTGRQINFFSDLLSKSNLRDKNQQDQSFIHLLCQIVPYGINKDFCNLLLNLLSAHSLNIPSDAFDPDKNDQTPFSILYCTYADAFEKTNISLGLTIQELDKARRDWSGNLCNLLWLLLDECHLSFDEKRNQIEKFQDLLKIHKLEEYAAGLNNYKTKLSAPLINRSPIKNFQVTTNNFCDLSLEDKNGTDLFKSLDTNDFRLNFEEWNKHYNIKELIESNNIKDAFVAEKVQNLRLKIEKAPQKHLFPTLFSLKLVGIFTVLLPNFDPDKYFAKFSLDQKSYILIGDRLLNNLFVNIFTFTKENREELFYFYKKDYLKTIRLLIFLKNQVSFIHIIKSQIEEILKDKSKDYLSIQADLDDDLFIRHLKFCKLIIKLICQYNLQIILPDEFLDQYFNGHLISKEELLNNGLGYYLPAENKKWVDSRNNNNQISLKYFLAKELSKPFNIDPLLKKWKQTSNLTSCIPNTGELSPKPIDTFASLSVNAFLNTKPALPSFNKFLDENLASRPSSPLLPLASKPTTQNFNAPSIITPHYLMTAYSNFSEKKIQDCYQKIVSGLLLIWTQKDIQPQLRQLINLTQGVKQINLSLAITTEQKLDSLCVCYILKPFFDFYYSYQKDHQHLIKAVIQDVIEVSQLSLCPDQKNEFLSLLNAQFKQDENYTNWLVELLLFNYQEQLKLEQFKRNHLIHSLPTSSLELSTSIRDILFQYSLTEIKVRAQHLKKIIQKYQPSASYHIKPAFLVYTVQGESFLQPLTLIKEGPTQSICAFGLDDVQQTSTHLLHSLLPDHTLPKISVEDLETLTLAYKQASPSSFYLFCPLFSDELPSNQDALPPLTTPLKIFHLSRKRATTSLTKAKDKEEVIQKKIKLPTIDTSLSVTSTHNKEETLPTLNPSHFNSHLTSVPKHLIKPNTYSTLIDPKKRFITEVNNDVSDEEQSDSNASPKKTKKPKAIPKETPTIYQELNVQNNTQIFKSLKVSEEPVSAVVLNPSLKFKSSMSDPLAMTDDSDIMEHLIQSQCDQAIQRIHDIVSINKLTVHEQLINSTQQIRSVLQQPVVANQIDLYDKQLKIYQQKGVSFSLKLAQQELGQILAFAPGLGKTKTAIEIILQFQKIDKKERPTLIIAPNSLVPQWKEALLKQLFLARKNYYTSLLPVFSSLTILQRKEFYTCLVSLYSTQCQRLQEIKNEIQSYQSKINPISTIQQLSDKERKEIHKANKKKQQKIQELQLEKDSFVLPAKQEALNLLKECLHKNNNLAIDILMHLNLLSLQSESIHGFLEEYCQTCVDIGLLSRNMEELKHRDFVSYRQSLQNCTTKDLSAHSHASLAALFKDLLMIIQGDNKFSQRNQLKQFLLKSRKNPIHDEVSTETILYLNSSLMWGNIYEQVIAYTSESKIKLEKEKYSIEKGYKIIVTTHSTLSRASEDLNAFQAYPWANVIIDEAHEWSWNLSDSNKLKDKKEASFIFHLIESLQKQHQTQRLLLTGTPFVNNYHEMLSMIKLANPNLNIESLATILHNRQVLLDRHLSLLFKEKESLGSVKDQSILNVNQAFLSFFLAFEYTRHICQRFIMSYQPNEACVREDWTIDGKVFLPEAQDMIISKPLTESQEKIAKEIAFEKNFLKADENFSCLTFHPWLAEKAKWKKKSTKEIKEEMQAWKKEDFDQFISQSSFLTHIFKSSTFQDIFTKKEPTLFFFSQIKFCAIFKILLKHYYPEIKSKLYNGEKDASIRAAIVNQFEDPTSPVKNLVLTPKAGGVGLNLPTAKHVIDMALWWHSAMQGQIRARALRAGKKDPTYIYEFMFQTVRELHKKHTSETKDKFQTAFLSKETWEKNADYIIEALTFNLVNIFIGKDHFEEISLILQKQKDTIRSLLQNSFEEIKNQIDNEIQNIQISEPIEIEEVIMQDQKEEENVVVPIEIASMQKTPIVNSQKISQEDAVEKRQPILTTVNIAVSPEIKNTKISTVAPSNHKRPLSRPNRPTTSTSASIQKHLNETTINSDSSITLNTHTQAISSTSVPKQTSQSNSILLPKQMIFANKTENLKFQVVPIIATTEQNAQLIAYQMMSHANHFGGLLKDLERLSEETWHSFLNNPQAFLKSDSSTAYVGLKTVYSQPKGFISRPVRWMLYDSSKGLSLLNPHENVPGALRILKNNNKYYLLIKLDK